MATGEHEIPAGDAHAGNAQRVGGGEDHDQAPGHAHRDDHAGGHDGETLGPIDWRAWGAGLLGIGCSALVAACLYVAVNAA